MTNQLVINLSSR